MTAIYAKPSPPLDNTTQDLSIPAPSSSPSHRPPWDSPQVGRVLSYVYPTLTYAVLRSPYHAQPALQGLTACADVAEPSTASLSTSTRTKRTTEAVNRGDTTMGI